MKITFVKEQIIEGLQKAASIIPAKTGAAYLRSIWLKAENNTVSIMSTDANIEFTGTYPAMVIEAGLVGVQGRAFVDLVRQLPAGDITLTTDEEGKSLLLQQGRRKYKLPVNDQVWFQPFAEFPVQNAVAWSGDFLQDVLERVTFCISDDEAKDAIACLYMKPCPNGRIEVCGLNSYQFALFAFTHDDLADLLPEEGVLVQKKYLADVKKWLGEDDIELNITEKRLHLRTMTGTEMLSLPRSKHQYPDYNTFLSRLDGDVSTLKITRKEALEALGRIGIFNTDIDRCTYIDLTNTEAILSARGQDVGSANESLEVEFAGDISRIAFPTRNLSDIMTHFTSEKLTLQLSGTEGPCGIRGNNDPEYLVIIMPMQIAETTYYSEEDV